MARSFRLPSLLAAAIMAVIGVGSAFAQSSTARVEGVVTDSSGGALPGVTVTATNIRTTLQRTDVTDRRGAYSIPALPVGDYRVTAELSGFAPEVTPITLSVNQVARIDVRLRSAAVSESVTVTATAPVIEKTTSEISTLIDQKQIENLPLNGRNFTQLATLVPGVTRGTPGGGASGGPNGENTETFRYAEFGGAALSVNGLREQFNNYLIEGIDNNESLVNTIAYLPPPEAIREFSVITTNAPAEFGRAGGAVQNLVIKSGTNQLDGSLYDFYRPRNLAVKPQFADKKPDFNNKDFGLTAGGPLIRDRTFFFGSYHGLRNSIPGAAGVFVTVPTAKMRNGDFSELLDTSVSGLSRVVQIVDPATGIPFPGNIIPPGLINPVSRAYLNVYPSPTRAGVTHNYLVHRQKQSDYKDFDGRIDHELTSSSQLFLGGSNWNDQFTNPGNIPGFQAGFGAGTSNNKGYALRLGHTQVITPNIVNEARGGWINYKYGFLPVGFGTDQDAALGIPGIGGVTTPSGISLIGGGDGTYIEYLGDFGQYVIKDRTFQLSDSLTWLHGVHSFKAGGTLMRRDMAQQRAQFGKGFYFFPDALGGGVGYSGYEVAEMLIGRTSFTTAANPGFVPRDTISWENALFVQDDWHFRPNLTFNLGVRWDVLTPYYEKDNKLANYDPTNGHLLIAGQNGVSRSTLKTNYGNFGPRLGFNYLLNEKTAIRGAYGVFYTLDRGGIDNQLTENPPAVLTQFRFSGPGANIRLSDPIPLPDPININNPAGLAVVYIPEDSKTPRVKQFSLSGQRELLPSTSLLVAYVGTRGDHLAAQLATVNGVKTIRYIAESTYDAIQSTLRRSESFGLSYLISYTNGHATTNAPGFFPGNPTNNVAVASDPNCAVIGSTCNLDLDRGPADYDARNRFTLAATYALPWMRTNPIVGGWSVNSVLTLQSGTPFTVFDSSGRRANQSGDPNTGAKGIDKWFNTSVFSPATGFQGTSRPNSVRGPATRTLDLSLFKTFNLARAGALELRVEGFNVFNWPQYGQPNQFLADPSFGKITTTKQNTERQIQLGARYLF